MADIFPGDIVKCKVGYYQSYRMHDLAKVIRLDVSSAGNPVLILKNSLCEYGESMYSLDNWELFKRATPKSQEPTVAAPFEKTKFFGVKLSNNQDDERHIWFQEKEITTPLVDTKSQALKDVQAIIKEGESWIILQTVARVEPVSKVPVQITEYR